MRCVFFPVYFYLTLSNTHIQQDTINQKYKYIQSMLKLHGLQDKITLPEEIMIYEHVDELDKGCETYQSLIPWYTLRN